MRESPQWFFMVHTMNPGRSIKMDWPQNVWIGCVIDLQCNAEMAATKIFKEITNAFKFVICDLHKEAIVFDDLSCFNWMIIRNLSREQPDWQWVEVVMEQSRVEGLPIYLMPNITVRPREYPWRIEEQNAVQEVVSHELAKGAA
jgi:protein gp37